jgi:redox-sensitive bicupin YhaK (pirin superfamily)
MAHLVRRDADIAGGSGGWYEARWHFSFGPYHDPDWNGLGPLRVLNDDVLVPGGVWPMHPHRDVQSLTYVVEGRFGHQDSLGNTGELEPGGVQTMTFGPGGAHHSELNASEDHRLRFLQFWILADRLDIPTSFAQRQYTAEERTDRWLTVMSPLGSGEGLELHQDAWIRVARLSAGVELPLATAEGRGTYLYVIDGAIDVELTGADGTVRPERLATGDALVITGVETGRVTGGLPVSELWCADVLLAFTPHGVWAS